MLSVERLIYGFTSFNQHLFVTKRILSSIFQPARTKTTLAGWKIEERILLVTVD
jgi:hypothetical protein